MQYPKISIIVVVYNAKDDFEKTLNNLAELKYPEKEIIVVDGNSTDGTKETIMQNSLLISQWISEKDEGIYDAMNKGLRMASGQYVWFVNAGDTVYSTHTLENIFKGNELLYDIYYGETLIVSQEGKIMGLRRKKLPEKLSWQKFINGMVVCHQSVIVKKEIAPMYDTRYRFSADYEWVLLALRKAETICNTHQVLSVFKEGGTTKKNRKASLKERYQIMRRYFGVYRTVFAHIGFAFAILGPKYRPPRDRRK